MPNFGHYMRETLRLKGAETRAICREKLDRERIKRIVLPGAMGGSAIGVGVLKMLLANQGFETEIELWPHYPAPVRRLRPGDLAVIYAYSGNNEEQLLWMAPALEAGAQVVGMAVGGRLEQMCREAAAPFVRIPGEEFGLAQPREHLPVALILLMLLAGETGVARNGARRFELDEWLPRVDAASRRLTALAESHYNVDAPAEQSVAKRAALFLNWGTDDPSRITNILRTRDPVFWISALYEPIARRLENQFGECVEHPASAKIMPEDMHNEQEAYTQQWLETVWPIGEASGAEPPASSTVFLRFQGPLDGRLGVRADKLFGDALAGAPRIDFQIQDYGADCPMAGELEAILFCDLTRAFASIFRGVTPHYVHSMNYIKHYMATIEGTPGSTGTY
ncbi:MAG: bifunctional phosphoglucose/phosphomannose isomerase [candidate division BRC1 bacterium ADurb.BinA364]|nr:MAG: bifunctional phosphoglucose/phosphomannose isomerase [candidate division BRC1 bacterium ADurb.BinA364]